MSVISAYDAFDFLLPVVLSQPLSPSIGAVLRSPFSEADLGSLSIEVFEDRPGPHTLPDRQFFTEL